MSRFVTRAAFAAGLAGLLLAGGSARADAPGPSGLACAGSVWAYDRPACRAARAAHRRVRPDRAMVADARLPLVDPALYGPDRSISLLILGVGY